MPEGTERNRDVLVFMKSKYCTYRDGLNFSFQNRTYAADKRDYCRRLYALSLSLWKGNLDLFK